MLLLGDGDASLLLNLVFAKEERLWLDLLGLNGMEIGMGSVEGIVKGIVVVVGVLSIRGNEEL